MFPVILSVPLLALWCFTVLQVGAVYCAQMFQILFKNEVHCSLSGVAPYGIKGFELCSKIGFRDIARSENLGDEL